jgi:ABC-type multidrug transport system fused ATPase/permease subunit
VTLTLPPAITLEVQQRIRGSSRSTAVALSFPSPKSGNTGIQQLALWRQLCMGRRLPVPRPGQVLGLVGTNGIGKSTALKILAGKLKPNLGRLEVAVLSLLPDDCWMCRLHC